MSNIFTPISSNIVGNNEDNFFGHSISLNGDWTIIAIGATNQYGIGFVKIFKNNGNSWDILGSDIVGDIDSDYFGFSVSLSNDGTIVAIGATRSEINLIGKVKIYKWNNIAWEPYSFDIDGYDITDAFGYSVSLNNNGSIVAISAPYYYYYTGIVKILKKNDTSYIQQGLNIIGNSEGDYFGSSLSLNDDGTIVAIGASAFYNNHNNTGYIKVFRFDNINWTQIYSDIICGNNIDVNYFSISLNGSGTIVAFGFSETNSNNNGRVCVYQNDLLFWNPLGDNIIGNTPNSHFGSCISLNNDGTIIVCGARGDNNNTGSVSVYQYNNASWNQCGSNINGTIDGGEFGYYVSSNDVGNIIAISAPSTNFNTGQVNIYQWNVPPLCFNEGTKILCLNNNFVDEYINIENLKKDCIVKTYKHGYRRIEMIKKNYLMNNPNKYNECMYVMKKI